MPNTEQYYTILSGLLSYSASNTSNQIKLTVPYIILLISHNICNTILRYTTDQQHQVSWLPPLLLILMQIISIIIFIIPILPLPISLHLRLLQLLLIMIMITNTTITSAWTLLVLLFFLLPLQPPLSSCSPTPTTTPPQPQPQPLISWTTTMTMEAPPPPATTPAWRPRLCLTLTTPVSLLPTSTAKRYPLPLLYINIWNPTWGPICHARKLLLKKKVSSQNRKNSK